uniref:Serine aminopeptidase S33 domain-containing protein n=1 Tax=Physcomitrium patens TaxID=3218 RepID=A0A7I4BVS2_PHYPA
MGREPHPCCDASSTSIYGELEAQEFYDKHGVAYVEDTLVNSRGLRQCWRSWVPVGEELRGVVCVCHGYGADSGWLVQLTCIAIAKEGYAVYAIDHQGHGKSEGLKGHIPDINVVVDDCIAFFDPRRDSHKGLPFFLYGESLGGAIALLIHLRQPELWQGVVLNGAMCGIGKFKPPWPAEYLLGLISGFIPTWPIVPTKDIPTVSFKEPWKRNLARINPNRPRAATAREFLRVVKEIEDRASEVTAPLLILHGDQDIVCDPDGSKTLHQNAASKDKTLHLYPGMWHQLVGEPTEGVEQVFGDMFSWLETHLSPQACT